MKWPTITGVSEGRKDNLLKKCHIYKSVFFFFLFFFERNKQPGSQPISSSPHSHKHTQAHTHAHIEESLKKKQSGLKKKMCCYTSTDTVSSEENSNVLSVTRILFLCSESRESCAVGSSDQRCHFFFFLFFGALDLEHHRANKTCQSSLAAPLHILQYCATC